MSPLLLKLPTSPPTFACAAAETDPLAQASLTDPVEVPTRPPTSAPAPVTDPVALDDVMVDELVPASPPAEPALAVTFARTELEVIPPAASPTSPPTCVVPLTEPEAELDEIELPEIRRPTRPPVPAPEATTTTEEVESDNVDPSKAAPSWPMTPPTCVVPLTDPDTVIALREAKAARPASTPTCEVPVTLAFTMRRSRMTELAPPAPRITPKSPCCALAAEIDRPLTAKPAPSNLPSNGVAFEPIGVHDPVRVTSAVRMKAPSWHPAPFIAWS